MEKEDRINKRSGKAANVYTEQRRKTRLEISESQLYTKVKSEHEITIESTRENDFSNRNALNYFLNISLELLGIT